MHVRVEVGEAPGDVGLWPMITPGTPEKVKPVTSYGQSASTSAVQAHLVPDAGHGRARGAGRWRGSASPSRCGRPRPPRSSTPGRRRGAEELGRGRGARDEHAAAPPARRGGRGRSGGRVGLSVASCSKTPSTIPPSLTIGWFIVVRVRRIELVAICLGQLDRQQRPVDLVLHVAAEVPGHRLEPGQRVDRRPLLRCVVDAGEAERGVLEGESAPRRGPRDRR